MDPFIRSLLQSLAEALGALQPRAGVSIGLWQGGAGSRLVVEGARAGTLTALARLPVLKDPLSGQDDGGDEDDEGDGVTRIGEGWWLLHCALRDHGGTPLGLARVVFPAEPTPDLLARARALADHSAVILEQYALHHELQQSFNGLFLVYEAGYLLNMSRTAGEVCERVVTTLTRTFHFTHCAVMLARDGMAVPVAHAGLDPAWAATYRLPVEQTLGTRVLREGAAAQFYDAADLDASVLPVLDGGLPPRSVLCTPLTTRAGSLGSLEIYRTVAEPFDDDDVFVVTVLAVGMAAALENARLYETLREREERLTDYAARLVTSQEEERRRISRDVHDGLGQMIVSAFQYLQAHEFSLPPEHPREAFRHGMRIVEECITETRRVMSDLRPSTLDDFGLVVALQQQLDTMAEEAGWQATFRVEGAGLGRLPPAVEMTVFRVVQEALNNARKHAETPSVRVTLSQQDGRVAVEVRDWGRGFAAALSSIRPRQGKNLGLMGMRERVALLGGDVTMDSTPMEGTTVRITLPIADE